MQHLTSEALARLVDEPPDPGEAAHVRTCLVCRREMEELRTLTVELADVPEPEPPAGAWAGLEARLLREGLIGSGSGPRVVRFRPPQPWLRAAAALALFLVGGGAGAALWSRWAAGPDTGPLAGVSDPPTLPAEQARRLSSGTDPEALAVLGAPSEGAVEAVPPAVTVGLTGPAGSRPGAVVPGVVAARESSAGAVERATRELDEAEAAYLAALERYAQVADPSSGADPVTRLAALERLVEITRGALEQTPGDPLINGYHLAALSERDNVRRELAMASAAAWH